MARTANINVRTEPSIKTQAEALYSQFGLSLSDAINVFLNVSIMEGGFPFAVKHPRFNRETEAAILEARKSIENNQDARRYASAKDLFTELDAEDN
jgi:DNA-damage-inducible protein J